MGYDSGTIHFKYGTIWCDSMQSDTVLKINKQFYKSGTAYLTMSPEPSTDVTRGQTSVQMSLLLIKSKSLPNFRFQISCCIVNSVGYVVVLMVFPSCENLPLTFNLLQSWETLCRISSEASVNRYVTLESGHRPVYGKFKSMQGSEYRCNHIFNVKSGYQFISVNLYTPSTYT